jgi:hypothetical protein
MLTPMQYIIICVSCLVHCLCSYTVYVMCICFMSLFPTTILILALHSCQMPLPIPLLLVLSDHVFNISVVLWPPVLLTQFNYASENFLCFFFLVFFFFSWCAFFLSHGVIFLLCLPCRTHIKGATFSAYTSYNFTFPS